MSKNTLRNIIVWSLLAVPFVPFLVSGSFFFPYITTKAFVFRILVEVALASWVVLAFINSEYRPKRHWLNYAVLGFVALVGLADLAGVAPVRSIWSNFERMEGYVLILHVSALYLVMSSVFKEADWKKWWNISLVASLLMVGYCTLQLLGLRDITQGGVRVDGTFGNAIYLAVYLLFHIFIAGIYLGRNWAKQNLRYWYSFLIITQLIILYFTATRGTILGLLVGLILLAVLNLKNKEQVWVKKASIGLLTALVLVVLSFLAIKNTEFVSKSPVLSRFATISLSELPTQGRYYIWPMALSGIKEHPILGWGQENFNYVFQKYYNPAMHNLEPWFDRAHNVYLDWAIAGGLLTLLAYLSLYYFAFRYVWSSSAFSYLDRTLLVSLLVAYGFHNIFVFDNLGSYILFFAVLAFVASNIGNLNAKREADNYDNQVYGLILAGVVLLTSFYLAVWKPYTANRYLLNALVEVQSGQQSKSIPDFKIAYESGPTGQQEVVEQMTVHATGVLGSGISMEEKNKFFQFALVGAIEQANKLPRDARVQLITGIYLITTGQEEEGRKYLGKAIEASPKKQDLYFNLSSAYFELNRADEAMSALKTAYDLDPTYSKAKTLYLVGAIYVGRGALEQELRSKFSEQELAFDDTVLGAYAQMKRYSEARALVEMRKKLDPANSSKYDSLLSQLIQ